MTTVYWTPTSTKELNQVKQSDEVQILFEEPKPLMKELLPLYKNYEMITCPALQAFCKNVFVVTAPMSATIHITGAIEGRAPYMRVEGVGWTQDFYDHFCDIRTDGTIAMPPVYVFYAKESVEMEVLPVFLLNSPSIDNILYIAGSYDIGKWIRPIDFSFVVKDASKPIIINRGDPLFFIRFKTNDNEKVTLERVEHTPQLTSMFASCTQIKHRVRNIPLPELYRLAKSHINLFLNRKKENT